MRKRVEVPLVPVFGKAAEADGVARLVRWMTRS